MTEIFFSPQRKAKLEQELANFLNVERATVASEIETAKSHGDLSENAEYHAARERQAKVEDRIAEIQHMLTNGKLINVSDTNVVSVGHTVVTKSLADDAERTYEIVGHEEQDFAAGKISNTSPIALALLGSKVGDQVEYQTPKGSFKLEVTSIKV